VEYKTKKSGKRSNKETNKQTVKPNSSERGKYSRTQETNNEKGSGGTENKRSTGGKREGKGTNFKHVDKNGKVIVQFQKQNDLGI